MPFLKLSEAELRETAKQYIETLEFWLRRVTNEILIQVGGTKYWEADPPPIKKEIREVVNKRIANSEPGRFPRWIDATLFEHQIEFIHNGNLYQNYFKEYFEKLFPENFPNGRDYLKFILKKCAIVRNAVYHSNPISVRQVEQTVCYTNDIIDSIKNYYTKNNNYMEFNAPSFVSWSDSLGNKIYITGPIESGKHFDYEKIGHKFRVGDRVRMSVEVDVSFDSNSYIVKWYKGLFLIIGEGLEVEVEFGEEWITQLTSIKVEVISNKTWHRYGNNDDDMKFLFSVLPPIE